jgi:hypothetical protein
MTHHIEKTAAKHFLINTLAHAIFHKTLFGQTNAGVFTYINPKQKKLG